MPVSAIDGIFYGSDATDNVNIEASNTCCISASNQLAPLPSVVPPVLSSLFNFGDGRNRRRGRNFRSDSSSSSVLSTLTELGAQGARAAQTLAQRAAPLVQLGAATFRRTVDQHVAPKVRAGLEVAEGHEQGQATAS